MNVDAIVGYIVGSLVMFGLLHLGNQQDRAAREACEANLQRTQKCVAVYVPEVKK